MSVRAVYPNARYSSLDYKETIGSAVASGQHLMAALRRVAGSREGTGHDGGCTGTHRTHGRPVHHQGSCRRSAHSASSGVNACCSRFRVPLSATAPP